MAIDRFPSFVLVVNDVGEPGATATCSCGYVVHLDRPAQAVTLICEHTHDEGADVA